MLKPYASCLFAVACLLAAGPVPAGEPTGPGPYESPTLRPPKEVAPPRPWAEAARNPPPAGKPGRDFTPAVVPNGATAEYRVVDGVKVFHLVA